MATVITPHLVTVQISNNVTSFMSEKRFEKGITIAALKVCLSYCTKQFCFSDGYTDRCLQSWFEKIMEHH